MGIQSDHKEILSDENSIENSPLDLSTTSKRFPFVHRSTSSDHSPPSSIELSIKTSHSDDRQMSVNYEYNEPMIITQPKKKWHYRNIKDLAKKHIPFVSGVGSQRTPIRVKIPEKYTQQMYLGIEVVTSDEQPHISKVIVPAKTRAKIDHLPHDNDLNCLLFDECNSMEYFDPVTRHVYLPITTKEHDAKLKEVRIHMFNLYQSQTITKELIEAKQLHLCKLAFWLCYFENQQFIPVSEQAFSCVIGEKKSVTRPLVVQ